MAKEVNILAYNVTGVVKWFDGDKGYGFIERTGNPDCFVHYTEIRTDSEYKSLCAGDKVEFDIAENNKGQLALNVTRIG